MNRLEWGLLIETELLSIEAELGDMDAQFTLATMYLTGKGIRQDLRKAFEWYSKSAEQGLADAQKNIGAMYCEGLGVEQDYNKAAEWLNKSAEQENVIAQVRLGMLYMKKNFGGRDFNKAYKWILKAYKNGDNTAHIVLLTLYHVEGILWDCPDDSNNSDIRKIKVKGNITFTCQDKTYSISANEFELILYEAESGNADAQYMLGVILFCGYLLDGNIIKRDYCQASKWFQKAYQNPSIEDHPYNYVVALAVYDGLYWHSQPDAQSADTGSKDADEESEDFEECYNPMPDKINDIIEALKKATVDDILNEIRKKAQRHLPDKPRSSEGL